MAKAMKICIVIPAHNEESRIARTLDDFKDTILKKYPKNLQFLVVSDGSTDRTNSIVKQYAKRWPQIKFVDNGNKKSGKGGALIKGFQLSYKWYDPDIIGFVDADPSISGQEVMKLIDYLLNAEDVDGVIASRYLKESKWIGNQETRRYVASRSYNAMVRLLFGLNFKDTQCGAKFFKAKAMHYALREVHLTDMSFDINLLYELHRRRFNIREVPVTYNVVKEGSKVRVSKQIPKMFVVTVSYRITRSPLNRLIPNKLKGKIYESVKSW